MTRVLSVLAFALLAGLVSGQGCPEQHGVQAYPHPDLCDHFYLCTNGTLTEEVCENGLLFDGKGAVHNHCNYHWAVNCGARKYELVPLSTPGCEFQFGIYAEAPCSTNYYKCAFGVVHPESCEPGLAYDDRTHSCNWPDLLLEQGCNPEQIVGFKCPDKVTGKAAKFYPFPRYAIPGDCTRSITCVNGFPRITACGEDKVFDAESLTCDEPELVPSCAHLRK
ncbi:Protein obstructor-E [Frankliniella fusca]|uniref:Protein obstructor-E n=1 Tax=Frankliniella fusca TaxID=407009 RepID=A0AAE1HVG2_9NEOP|nr:Protein obstructor-E [Frankliniella fusca]